MIRYRICEKPRPVTRHRSPECRKILEQKRHTSERPFGDAARNLLAGTIDLVPDYLLANKQNIDAGKLKLLGTGSRERLKDYPNVATIAETLPGVYADTWMAVEHVHERCTPAPRQGHDKKPARHNWAPGACP